VPETGTIMAIRTTRTTVTFKHPFALRGYDGVLPAGDYRVLTDEELIDGLSYLAYRRVATLIFPLAVLPDSPGMFAIEPEDLAAAQERDRAPQAGNSI
jgi:hypothetical protein